MAKISKNERNLPQMSLISFVKTKEIEIIPSESGNSKYLEIDIEGVYNSKQLCFLSFRKEGSPILMELHFSDGEVRFYIYADTEKDQDVLAVDIELNGLEEVMSFVNDYFEQGFKIVKIGN